MNFTTRQITHFEPSQSLVGAKTGEPQEKHLSDHPQNHYGDQETLMPFCINATNLYNAGQEVFKVMNYSRTTIEQTKGGYLVIIKG